MDAKAVVSPASIITLELILFTNLNVVLSCQDGKLQLAIYVATGNGSKTGYQQGCESVQKNTTQASRFTKEETSQNYSNCTIKKQHLKHFHQIFQADHLPSKVVRWYIPQVNSEGQ